jgi:site-specific DNA-cytosine methylase
VNFLSLFSGIGLHDLGFERAGWRCVGQVELDPFAAAVLAKHWPHVPRWCDVRSVTVDAVRGACGRIDAICGGFMCTDISVAGKGAGLGKRTRSGLTWREMFRLIRGLRPVLLVIENVPRLRTLGADRVLAALERIGYACRALVVGAEHVGAPHRRHRVWIVGHSRRAASERNAGGLHPAQAGERGARIEDGDCPNGPESSSAGSRARRTLDDTERARRQQGSGDTRHEEGTRGGRGEPVVADRVANPLSLDSGSGLPVAVGEAEGRTAAHRSGDCIFPGGCWRCANVADTASDRRATEGQRAATGHPHGDRQLWPSRPGNPQHAWEAPRLTQSGVGGAASRRAGRVAGFARRNALRALGNGNPPQVAEAVARAINQALETA